MEGNPIMAEGGVLTGPEIRKEIYSGGIVVDPFNEDQVNPASYDLTLGEKLAVYKRSVYLGGGTKRVWVCLRPSSTSIRRTIGALTSVPS